MPRTGTRRLRPKDCLRAYWSRAERDLMLHWPAGESTTSDAHWLAGVLNREVRAELTRRGYDVTTLRFSVAPQPGNRRFASQRPVA